MTMLLRKGSWSWRVTKMAASSSSEALPALTLDVAATLRATTAKQLIVAGGIHSRAEVDALDAMGVDAVAGMAFSPPTPPPSS